MTNQTSIRNYVAVTPRINRFLLLSPLSIDEQREIYEGVQKLKAQYSKLPGVDAPFEFDDNLGIKGSNFPLLVLANIHLANEGERTPAFWEAMQLDKKGLLTNGVYRDYGIAVYDPSNPNSELATHFIELAKVKGFEPPILIHPASVRPTKKGTYELTKDDSLIVYGGEAREYLNQFICVGSSGVQRLNRGRGAYWGANWYYPFSSNEGGRVDWVCAEGTRKNLEASLASEIETAVQEKTDSVLADIASKREKALAFLK